jgi:carbonic anhydrase/acetyltransferase-like protein (isoleucine patch superfamily)
MKKLVSALSIFIVSFFVLSVSPISAKVMSSQEGDIAVAKGEIINDDLFVAAQGVTIDGTVNGDVFIGAQSVKIGGIINGNLHIGAQTVNLSGTVKGNSYIGAQTLTVTSGKIGGSIITGLQSLSIDNATTIGGSVITGAANANINSQIKRNVMVGAGILTIGDNAKIGKDLYYASGAESGQTSISEKAVISGTIHKAEATVPQKEMETAKKDATKFLAGAKVVSTILSYLGALLVGLLAFKLFGPFMEGSIKKISGSLWKSLGIGFLIMIATVPALIIMLMTVIGIPVAGLTLLLLILYSCLAKIVVGSAMGNLITAKFNWKVNTFWSFAFGLLIIYLLKLIPVAGIFVSMAVSWIGLGAITLHIFSKKNA